MREIKFRAWDKQNKFMHYACPGTTFEFDEDGFLGMQSPYIDGEHMTFTVAKNMELMQYTGLKDKNGKEIYEGDIVRDSDTGVYSIEICTMHNFLYSAGYRKGLETMTSLLFKMEVIGNIYENPELISGGIQ